MMMTSLIVLNNGCLIESSDIIREKFYETVITLV